MAGYKDLLVYVDDAPSCAVRLKAAADVARTSGAHLTGLAVAELTMIPEFVPANVMEQLHRDAAGRNDRLRERFEGALQGETVTSEWRATDQLAAGGTVLDVLALHARYADLVVVGQVDPDATRSLVPNDLAAELALVSGRPVLAIPYAWEPRPIGRRVLVGWNAGREAARAVGDALPFLEAAESVRVAAFTRPGHSAGHGEVPGADIAAHLARHGVPVESQHGVVPEVGAADAILAAADDYAADLIVMGAYGRARLREMVLGGTTRAVLQQMTVPVLMSH